MMQMDMFNPPTMSPTIRSAATFSARPSARGPRKRYVSCSMVGKIWCPRQHYWGPPGYTGDACCEPAPCPNLVEAES
jgi:hypothetical protein